MNIQLLFIIKRKNTLNGGKRLTTKQWKSHEIYASHYYLNLIQRWGTFNSKFVWMPGGYGIHFEGKVSLQYKSIEEIS